MAEPLIPRTFPRVRLAVAAILALALILVGRSRWEPRLAPGVLIEVSGDVPNPGTFLVADATIGSACLAAGLPRVSAPMTQLPPGHRVQVRDGIASTVPSPDAWTRAAPIDVNTADVDALAAIPGVGRAAAVAIVDERGSVGPYSGLDDLRRARGVHATTIEALRPHARTSPVRSRGPLDLNRATAAELERLPGIGSITAARIVVDRLDRGPFAHLADLSRVRGIGDGTVRALGRQVSVAPPGGELAREDRR